MKRNGPDTRKCHSKNLAADTSLRSPDASALRKLLYYHTDVFCPRGKRFSLPLDENSNEFDIDISNSIRRLFRIFP